MRILMANTYYYLRGGDCTYTFSLTDLLRANGHEIVPFAMHHPKNFGSEYSKHFVEYIDYAESLKNFGLAAGIKVASKAIYSFEASKKIQGVINEFEPEIAHLQNIHHHLTPSILYPLKKRNIPVVWTLHDYKLVCPNSSYLRGGEVCERCGKLNYYSAALTKCKKNSYAASFMASIEAYAHRLLRIRNLVDLFIAPSNFLRNKLIEYGFNESHVKHLPNFINSKPNPSSHTTEDYFVYVGRLSEEKGVDTLLQAVDGMKGAHLAVVGDGPFRGELEAIARNSKDSQVEFLGHVQPKTVNSIIQKAMFVVVPSKWYENCPYSIIEAFALGKPVIGARIGGIPELIKDGKTGFLFEPGNIKDLQEKIGKLAADASLRAELGREARATVETVYSSEAHYEGLIEIYRDILN